MTYLQQSILYILLSFLAFQTATIQAQVAIGTTQLDAGAIFQVDSNDKGVLIPRISLTSNTDVTTIENPAEGLTIYNIATVNNSTNSITPGLYYWNGVQWSRLLSRGYSRQFIQESQNLINTTSDVPINGLNQTIEVPFSGIYRVIVTSYFGLAPVANPNISDDNVALASVRLEVDGGTIDEKLIPAFSKFVDDTATGGDGSINFFALSRQVVITKDIELIAGQSYNFNVISRLWDWTNVTPAIGAFAYFGLDTSLYERNPGLTDEASRTKMTINLVRQY
ncbi:hypothetical protein [uncultured Dokdonia sp.]|uniref:hypothetical protein n=1 Tax=uncultured Dokdonia sp. TaxID=575653 RepID=UPI0026283A1F|nr:hypothetical protein [uncultured Dokdonia sp.]